MEPQAFGPLIGRRGSSEVYRAFDTRRHRVVALKRLVIAGGAAAEFLARFRHEVADAARLCAPHIVSIYDYGDIDG
jgi:serine/threonine-protein kinase